MRIPFVDLVAQYRAHQAEFDDAFKRVIERAAFIGGDFVKQFETDYARACGVKNCVAVANGTDAIYVVLRMLGIGAGDEVITSAMSWIATSEVVTQSGARVVFVDIDEFHGIDAAAIEQRITARTKAIIPVHLYGQPAEVDAIADICRRRGIHLIEDCAQAHLATLDGRVVGTFGSAATFSFYPAKNLGAYGDAGAIITNDDELARRCRMFANHGAIVKHEHLIEGINSRLDGLQASLLSSKLMHLQRWTSRRQEIAGEYDRLLADIPGVRVPAKRERATHVYHLYVINAVNRDALREYLKRNGIETQIHYPTPLPLLPAYNYLGARADDFPRASLFRQEILSLPIYPEMTQDMVEYVCDKVGAFYGSRR